MYCHLIVCPCPTTTQKIQKIFFASSIRLTQSIHWINYPIHHIQSCKWFFWTGAMPSRMLFSSGLWIAVLQYFEAALTAGSVVFGGRRYAYTGCSVIYLSLSMIMRSFVYFIAEKNDQEKNVCVVAILVSTAAFLCTKSAKYISNDKSNNITFASNRQINAGPTLRFTSIFASAARLLAVLPWICVPMLCPRLLKTSVLSVLGRRGLDSPDQASTVSSLISCARVETSRTTTVQVESPST